MQPGESRSLLTTAHTLRSVEHRTGRSPSRVDKITREAANGIKPGLKQLDMLLYMPRLKRIVCIGSGWDDSEGSPSIRSL